MAQRNSTHVTGINSTTQFNASICSRQLWNNTLPSICSNLTKTSLNGTRESYQNTIHGQEPQESVIIRFFLIALIFVLILVGNSLTIHVVRNNRNLTSIKNYYYGYYIMNLSISDLLVGLICLPTTFLYYLLPGPWIFGLFLCKLFPTLQIMVVSASISTLTVITFERFLAIVHPLKPRSTSTSVRLKIIGIWFWSFIIALPSFIAYKINSKQQCYEDGIAKWYTIVLFLVNYALPLCFIFVTYLRIICEMRSHNCARSKREVLIHRKFLKLTVLLVVAFAVCFLPNNVVFFILDYSDAQIDVVKISILLQYFHVLIWFNSCLNPFIYGSVDTYFKRGFKKALGLGSSHDSQDRTNVSRMSTFKCEKPGLESYTRLSSTVISKQSNNSVEHKKSTTFGDREGSLDSKNNNSLTRYKERETIRMRSERVSGPFQNITDKTGYVSLVLYRTKCESNVDLIEGNDIDDKEVFVDLDPRKRNDLEAARIHQFKLDMTKEEFELKFKLSRETVI